MDSHIDDMLMGFTDLAEPLPGAEFASPEATGEVGNYIPEFTSQGQDYIPEATNGVEDFTMLGDFDNFLAQPNSGFAVGAHGFGGTTVPPTGQFWPSYDDSLGHGLQYDSPGRHHGSQSTGSGSGPDGSEYIRQDVVANAMMTARRHEVRRDETDRDEGRVKSPHESEVTLYSFWVPLESGSDRGAKVKLRVTPIVAEDQRPQPPRPGEYTLPFIQPLPCHTIYLVDGSYTPSHEDVEFHHIADTVQAIYDLHIKVTRLRLDEKVLERQPADSTAFAEFPELDPSVKTPARAADKQALMLGRCVLNGQKKRKAMLEAEERRRELSEAEQRRNRSRGAENAGTTSRRTSRQKQKEVVDLTYVLLPKDENQSHKSYLDTVEETLNLAHQNAPAQSPTRWTIWYFLSCLQLVLDPRRVGGGHPSAKSAKVINLVMDNLFVSKKDPMILLDIFAEYCYKGARICDLHNDFGQRIVETAAKEIRSEDLMALDDEARIPLPLLWLRNLLPQLSLEEICADIGLPNIGKAMDRIEETESEKLAMKPVSALRKHMDLATDNNQIQLTGNTGPYSLGPNISYAGPSLGRGFSA